MRIAARVAVPPLCLLLAACGSTPGASPAPSEPTTSEPAPTSDPALTSEPTAIPATPAEEPDREPDAGTQETAEACSEVEHPQIQAGSHLIGDTEPPVPYSSTPPTSGWHASGALDVTVHDETDPLTEPEQVSVLEADGVVISYRDLPEDDVATLVELVEGPYAGRVALTPYEVLEPGTMAMTAWGVLQRCTALDLEVVEAFLDEHLGDEVSPGHSH